MADQLMWSEKTVAAELARALGDAAACIKRRPGTGDLFRAAVLARLGDDERRLLAKLNEDPRTDPTTLETEGE